MKLLSSSNLTALKMKDGGIRPVSVGNVFRVQRLRRDVTPFLAQCRMSFRRSSSVFRSMEVRKRLSTSYVNSSLTTSTKTTLPVRSDHVLQTCLDSTPEIAKLSFIAYSKPSIVTASGHSMTSLTGVQQGYPIGPLLFALIVDQIACGIESELNVWYLDDMTIGGCAESVLSDVHH